jgi:hypothetical protein
MGLKSLNNLLATEKTPCLRQRIGQLPGVHPFSWMGSPLPAAFVFTIISVASILPEKPHPLQSSSPVLHHLRVRLKGRLHPSLLILEYLAR